MISSNLSAIHALIGYTEILTPGTVITQEYCDRLREHYIPGAIRSLNEHSAGICSKSVEK